MTVLVLDDLHQNLLALDLDKSGVEMFFFLLLFIWGYFLWLIESIFWKEGSQQRVFCTKVKEKCDIPKNTNNSLELLTAHCYLKVDSESSCSRFFTWILR